MLNMVVLLLRGTAVQPFLAKFSTGKEEHVEHEYHSHNDDVRYPRAIPVVMQLFHHVSEHVLEPETNEMSKNHTEGLEHMMVMPKADHDDRHQRVQDQSYIQ